MMIRFLTLSAMLNLSIASTVFMGDVDIPLESKVGNRLLSKARRLDNNNDDGVDFTWAMDYSLKFDSCHRTIQYREGGGKSGDEDGSPYETQLTVQFKLCPSDSCGWCRKSGVYLVEMREFLESYFDFQLEEKENNCDAVKNSCACDDDQNDDGNCYSQCYLEAGLDYCDQFESGDGDDGNAYNFDVSEYLECREVGENDDDSNNLFIGPTCSSNGKNIYLAEFQDEECSKAAKSGGFKALTGTALPFSTTSLVSDDCISCLQPAENDDDNANDDANQADGVREFCDELYDRSSKCEKNLKGVDYQSNGGCEYIHKMLPQAENMARGSVPKSTVFAWLFLCTTAAVSVYAVLLFRRLKRTQVSLASQGYGVTA